MHPIASLNVDAAGRRSDSFTSTCRISSEVSMKQNIAKISEARRSFLSLLQETWGGEKSSSFYPPAIIFSRSPPPLRVPSKELIRLKSPRCEFSSLQHISGGLSSSHAINCGGVLSIRMNNLRGMLIGIPVLAKGTETKCCWKTFHHFCLSGSTSFVFFSAGWINWCFYE